MSQATQPIAATCGVSPDLSIETIALCSNLLDSVTVFKARASCQVLRKRSRGNEEVDDPGGDAGGGDAGRFTCPGSGRAGGRGRSPRQRGPRRGGYGRRRGERRD